MVLKVKCAILYGDAIIKELIYPPVYRRKPF